MTQATMILPNLYLGGMPKDIEPYQYVVCVGERPTYWIPAGKMVIVNPLNDSHRQPDIVRLYQLANMVNMYSTHSPTLVHCTMGMNRSALVVAATLILHHGMDPAAVIAMLREQHHRQVLKNETFEQWLLSLKYVR